VDEARKRPSLLIEEARQGKPGALDCLLARYRDYLQRVARPLLGRLLRRRDDSSDLAHDTFIKARLHFDQFRGSTEAELTAWLRRILAHCLADLVRKVRGRRGQREPEQSYEQMVDESSNALGQFPVDGAPTPSQAAEQRDLGVVLADALAALSQDHREVLDLRYYQKLSWDEVAERMGRSVKAVRMLYARALQNLRREFEDRL
jgi:RNA polymerase sigma-70 factor (ECF subfamily)